MVFFSLGMIVFALVGAQRLSGDPFQHYAVSVDQLRRWDSQGILTNVWNKPVVSLLYGLPGLIDERVARIVAALVTCSMVYLSGLSIHRALDQRLSVTAGMALTATQLAVLRHGFVTMTEIPAALCLAAALFFALRRANEKLVWAAFCFGLAPLFRIELAPLTAIACFQLALERPLQPQRGLSILLAGSLPFLLWMVAGWMVTGDPLWLRESSYASLRSFELPYLLIYNAIAGLPRNLPSISIVLASVGLFALGARRAKAVPRMSLVVVCLGVHYLVLSILQVYPSGEGGTPVGHAVAAINDRNFTPTAPMVAMLAAVGWSTLIERSMPAAALIGSCLFTLGTIFLRWGLSPDVIIPTLSLLVFAIAALVRMQHRFLPHAAVYALLGVASLGVRPLFFYPLRSVDKKAEAIDALARSIAKSSPRPQAVIQDLASGLFLDPRVEGVQTHWIWPTMFATVASSFDEHWIVIQTYGDFSPRSGYSREVLESISKRSEYQEVHRFESTPSHGWVRWADRISKVNRPVRWIAYRRIAPPAHRRTQDAGNEPPSSPSQ